MTNHHPVYILQVDELRKFCWSVDGMKNLIKILLRRKNSKDMLLHLGGLPYLLGIFGLSCLIYATIPIFSINLNSKRSKYLLLNAKSAIQILDPAVSAIYCITNTHTHAQTHTYI